ncbi:hypothetical protein A4V04_02010 [Burkholderiales bacterium YL45]|uniref:Uncharacterized protein n=1 Tax=Turicimonas muris TaxID=1796652 RepID=A0A227KTA6_9BURK|nr:hypothetical protein A4V04_02010 [Burkholderiales bacterium YL45]OXE51134.1 hypothetical protein ADH67_02250 [Turicimonas muris]
MHEYIKNSYFVFNNPFLLTPVLVSFFQNYTGREDNFLLSYLVLPLSLPKEGKAVLGHINSRSTLNKLQENNNVLIFRLNSRLTEYRELTNHCIQYSLDNDFLVLNGLSLTVGKNVPPPSRNSSIKDSAKVSANLGKLLSKYRVVDIFRFLGVKGL